MSVTAGLLKDRIKRMENQIEWWTKQVYEKKQDLERLNRWIDFEQADIDDAKEMLNRLEPTEGVDEEGNETYETGF